MRRIFLSILATSITWSLFAEDTQQESSFQLAPAPIPYPYFDPGTVDGKIDFSYLKLTMENYTLSGMSLFGKMRAAPTDSVAFDGMAGLMHLSGQMPGAPPYRPYRHTPPMGISLVITYQFRQRRELPLSPTWRFRVI